MSMPRLAILGLVLAGAAATVPGVAPDLVKRFAGLSGADAPPVPIRPARARETTIRSDERGHFLVEALLDGRRTPMMIDTGATVVALTEATAARLGIRPARSEFTAPIATAGGTIKAAPAVIDEIDIDGIAIRRVEAVVVPGDALAVDLLGMSYLRRLSRFEMAGHTLTLVE
jgi:aspartyl protease family protein